MCLLIKISVANSPNIRRLTESRQKNSLATVYRALPIEYESKEVAKNFDYMWKSPLYISIIGSKQIAVVSSRQPYFHGHGITFTILLGKSLKFSLIFLIFSACIYISEEHFNMRLRKIVCCFLNN
uniref:Uncharacterized protein n=1 Tax=Glossina pallidipes TaxID=7398 RepID=A0A1B0A768_GLOPL